MGERRDAWRSREDGFTLTELAVVMVIIAVLVAIATPLFLRHKEDARNVALQTAAKAAATAAETYTAGANGSYLGLDGSTSGDPELVNNGYNAPSSITVTILASTTAFCATATQEGTSLAWKFASTHGEPRVGTCATAKG